MTSYFKDGYFAFGTLGVREITFHFIPGIFAGVLTFKYIHVTEISSSMSRYPRAKHGSRSGEETEATTKLSKTSRTWQDPR
ncbi:hypothetical protein X975_09901, partial [Stegodyphus mimosarum]